MLAQIAYPSHRHPTSKNRFATKQKTIGGTNTYHHIAFDNCRRTTNKHGRCTWPCDGPAYMRYWALKFWADMVITNHCCRHWHLLETFALSQTVNSNLHLRKDMPININRKG